MDDFDAILTTVEQSVHSQIERAIHQITRVETESDKDYWALRRRSIPSPTSRDRKRLAEINWSRHGNLRGLMAVVDQMMTRDLDPTDAIDRLAPIESDAPAGDLTSVMVEGLRQRRPSSGGLLATSQP